MFTSSGVWRDKLAFTWDYRTFNFKPAISRAASDLLPSTKVSNLRLITPAPSIERPYPDLSYLQFSASFDTQLVNASVVINAVQTGDRQWKIWTMHTVAEELLQFPERGPSDGHMTGELSWEKQREIDDDSVEPEVLVIGGGQKSVKRQSEIAGALLISSGLAIAARLKALGVSTLIVERGNAIGEVWRKRYEYLSLHFPHWADHFAYMPFPKHWPTYTPAQKLGIFMEWYASAMELPVWTRSNVTEASQDAQDQWTVKVSKDGQIRTLHPKHVVSNVCHPVQVYGTRRAEDRSWPRLFVVYRPLPSSQACRTFLASFVTRPPMIAVEISSARRSS